MSIHIDEERKHVLTSITRTKNGPKIYESDHNSILTKFNLKWKENDKQKIEVFNFNDKEGQKKFNKMTNKTVKHI